MNNCPVCGFGGLDSAPYNTHGEASFEICSSCGFQFGYDDAAKAIGYEKFRAEWKNSGCKWWSQSPAPEGWDPFEQLKNIERQ